MKQIILLLLIAQSIIGYSQQINKIRIKEILSTLASDDMKGRLIGSPENENAAKYIAKQFKKNNLDYCVGNSYLVPFKFNGSIVYNVCGIKKGKTDKFLAFSAHFDHLGFSNNTDDDNIFNGADDDASGVTVVISLSDYFKNRETDFSHIYMAFNGEEIGLLGSYTLANRTDFDEINKNISSLFNFEMMGLVSRYGENSVYMTGDDVSDLYELINKFAKKGLKIYPDPYKEENLFYRSDNVSYVKKGIISHSFSTVNMESATHYHKVNDDIDIIDFNNLSNLINSFAKTFETLNPKNFQPKYNDNLNK